MSVPVLVNDVHSALTPTEVPEIHFPGSIDELVRLVRKARAKEWRLSVCGGKHSMGGQPYGRGSHLVDLARLNRVLELDDETGLLRCQAGIMWPALVSWLKDQSSVWMIRQKQTGADHLSLGGALAVNMHGRGLGMAPFAEDLEALTVVAADGMVHLCSRTQNRELFSRVVGGYGCFGIVVEVVLRLKERKRYRRSVTLIKAAAAVDWLEHSKKEGAEYGDFQFQIDPESDGFLQEGISSCYHPTSEEVSGGEIPKLDPAGIEGLLHLAHFRPGEAFRKYTDHYQKTDGLVYDGDEMQLSAYPLGYHQRLDHACGAQCRGSEMISELYVPREKLAEFLASAARFLRKNGSKVIYGTVRLIEKDQVTFLPWARENWACIVLNLHVDHNAEGIHKAKAGFRGLIDLATGLGGTFYLSYHRWASRKQLLAAYPGLPDWIEMKKSHDPEGLWSSDWFSWLLENVTGRESSMSLL